MIKQAWQNYCDQFPYKWQWWISGFVYGILFGKWFERIRNVRDQWQPELVEYFTWLDAVLLTFDLEWSLYSDEDTRQWFLNRDYSFKAPLSWSP